MTHRLLWEVTERLIAKNSASSDGKGRFLPAFEPSSAVSQQPDIKSRISSMATASLLLHNELREVDIDYLGAVFFGHQREQSLFELGTATFSH